MENPGIGRVLLLVFVICCLSLLAWLSGGASIRMQVRFCVSFYVGLSLFGWSCSYVGETFLVLVVAYFVCADISWCFLVVDVVMHHLLEIESYVVDQSS